MSKNENRIATLEATVATLAAQLNQLRSIASDELEVDGGGNLLKNGDFENSTAGWTTSASAVLFYLKGVEVPKAIYEYVQELGEEPREVKKHGEVYYVIFANMTAMFDSDGTLRGRTGIWDDKAEATDSKHGLRANSGKIRYDLLPPDFMDELAKVYTMGAVKYAPRNWEKGFPWMECFGSLLRHAFAWARGEDRDEESGLLHMAHVAWNAIAIGTFMLRNVGTDDRQAG